jgi:hypothetical protein
MFVMPGMTTGPERLMLEHMLDRNRQALIDTAKGLSTPGDAWSPR